jgi:hypothetical protein
MEYWKNGVLECWSNAFRTLPFITPLLQYSSTPEF